jgi:O-antigen/teichoic acid export membrane protein
MKKDLFIYMTPPVLRGLLSVFVSVPISTYYLSPEDFGIFAAVTMVSALLTSFTHIGPAMAQGYYFRVEPIQRKTMLFNTMLLAIALNLVLCVTVRWSAPSLLPWFISSFQPSYLTYFDLSLFGILLTTPIFLTTEVLVLENRSVMLALLETGQFCSGLFTNILCLTVFDLKTLALFAGPLAMGVFVSLFSALVLVPRMRFRLDWRWIVETARREFALIPTRLGDLTSVSMERYTVQRWYSLAQLGFYNHSLSYRALMLMANEAFRKVLSPVAVKAITKKGSIESIRRIGRVWMALLSLGSLFVTLFGKEMLAFLTHGKFVTAAPMAAMWCFMAIGIAWNWYYSQFLITNLKTKSSSLSSLAGSLFSISTIICLVYYWGPLGAVLGAGTGPWVSGLIRYCLARRLGSPGFLNKSALITLAFFVTAYALTYLGHAGFWLRTTAFCFLSAGVCIHFKLYSTLFTTLRQLRDLAHGR